MADTVGLTYAIPDLHGRRDLLDMALEKIERHAAGHDGSRTLVFLGDYVDRGPDGFAVVERLIGGAPGGWRWVCLKGNHEAMMVMALRNPERLEWWIDNGGDTTIVSYRDRQDRVAGHLAWMDALPTMHVDAHRVYVHAGVDPAIPLAKQAERTLIWKRYPDDAAEGHGTHHVVHGHDPHIDGPMHLSGRTDLDTLAWRTGRLVIGTFDDAVPGGPVELIEVKGPLAHAAVR